MSIPATENAILHLKPDVTIEDASSEAGKTFAAVREMVAAQKGFQRQYWGRQLEDPNNLITSIDWDNISDHHAWIRSPSYKEFIELGSPIFDFSTRPYLLHTNYASHPPNEARDAPVTEFIYFSLPKDASADQKSSLEDAVLNVIKACTTSGSASAGSVGWVVEETDHEKGTDGKAVSISAILGWPSKEAHMSFREEKDFLAAVGPVRGIALAPKGLGKDIYHAKLIKY